MANPVNSIDSKNLNYINRTWPSTENGKVKQTEGKVYSPNELAFNKILNGQFDAVKKNELQFSKHAAARVEQRGIELTKGLLENLSDAVETARDKGAKNVVVIGREGAFIVNVDHNVVVTTMNSHEMKQNVFTNIDSAVII